MTSFKSHNNGRKYIMIISVVVVLGRKTQILENAFIYFAFYSQKESQNAVEFESYKTYNDQMQIHIFLELWITFDSFELSCIYQSIQYSPSLNVVEGLSKTWLCLCIINGIKTWFVDFDLFVCLIFVTQQKIFNHFKSYHEKIRDPAVI